MDLKVSGSHLITGPDITFNNLSVTESGGRGPELHADSHLVLLCLSRKLGSPTAGHNTCKTEILLEINFEPLT